MVLFVATVSCALACPQVEVAQRTSCSEPQAKGCCEHPIDGRCLECVETNFFEGSKDVAATLAAPPDTCVKLTQNYPGHEPFLLGFFLPADAIYLTNSAFLI